MRQTYFIFQKSIWILLLILGSSFITMEDFRTKQLKFERVVHAFYQYEQEINNQLIEKNINPNEFELFLRAFKFEKKLEIWVKDPHQDTFVLFNIIDFCASSGQLGPKRKEGDGQIPEGLYQISNFNPMSNYHLSLRVNYPNDVDKKFVDPYHPGGDIYIHGGCETIGCIPITDVEIQKLYVLAVKGKNKSPYPISIHIFPSKMTPPIMKYLLNQPYSEATKKHWLSIAPAYHYFNIHKQIPYYTINKEGYYELNE